MNITVEGIVFASTIDIEKCLKKNYCVYLKRKFFGRLRLSGQQQHQQQQSNTQNDVRVHPEIASVLCAILSDGVEAKYHSRKNYTERK